MKIGLVGFPGAGKSTVFGALTGLAVGRAAPRDKARLGVVKVPDARVDALAKLFQPKKKTYAEITFTDLAGGHGEGLDRGVAERDAPARRALPGGARLPGARRRGPGTPRARSTGLATETILADLELVERG